MKKILLFSFCLVLTFCLFLSTFAAAPSVAIDMPTQIKKDEATTVNVKLSNTPTLSSALIQIELSADLELVSGEWTANGALKDFTTSASNGVLALSSPGVLDGDVFKLVVKGKNISSQQIKVTFTFKNGTDDIGSASATKEVNVICATHTFGAYQATGNTQHSRTCGVCNFVEEGNHTWNSGTITKSPSCKTTGTKLFTCTTCNATKEENIPVTSNHTYGAWSQTKAPTCSDKGQQIRTCSICQKSEFSSINALGHSFEDATVIKAPTCSETGIESGRCTRCNQESTNVIPMTEHSFGQPVIIKEATATEAGTKLLTCQVCGHEKEEEIPPLSAEITPTPTPDESFDNTLPPIKEKAGISPWWLLVVAILAFALGVAVGFIFRNKIKHIIRNV